MMKKYLSALICVMAASGVFAGQGFHYTATVSNFDGTYVAGKELTVRFSIKNSGGDVLFTETHRTHTDRFGRFDLVVGDGEDRTADLDALPWRAGGLTLQTEIDRGSGFTLSGTQSFGAVPYALQAGEVAEVVARSSSGSFWRMTVDDEGRLGSEKVESELIAIPEGYSRMVFHDEFDGEGFPDDAHWSYEKGYVRNGEMQYYTDKRKDNCWIENGCLNITARNDDFVADGQTHKVTSASVHTRHKEKWTYCRVDVRAKLPACLGSWPAIWMMPNDDFYGYWPNSGEIDIMENVGYDRNKVHFTAHCAEQNGANNKYHHQFYLPTSYTDFHVYSLVWTEDKLSWLVDDKVKFTIKKSSNTWRGWPYNKDFYLILNLAFGGGWGGQQGVDLTQLPITYQVDYVRIFQ